MAGWIYWMVHKLSEHVATILCPLKYLRGLCSRAMSPREIKYIQDEGLAQGHLFLLFLPLLTTPFSLNHTDIPRRFSCLQKQHMINLF